MKNYIHNTCRLAATFLIALLLFSGGQAQEAKSKKKDSAKTAPSGKAILWESVDINAQDLFNGPGGTSMKPDLSKIEFIKKEKGGHNKKYRIKDGSGRIWVAKPGTEARSETIAVRLLAGLGYKTEINYLVPEKSSPRQSISS